MYVTSICQKFYLVLIRMSNPELEHLRDIAFEITIDPNNPLHAASAEDVVQVLNAYIASFKSYLEIKLKSDSKTPDEIGEILKDAKLMVVDTDFNSFHSSLVGYNPVNNQPIPFFDNYKSEIIESNLDSYQDVLELRNNYTKEELRSIYNPIFSATSKNYSLKIKTNRISEKKVNKPRKEFETYFKPKRISSEILPEENKLYSVIVQTPDLNSISTKNIIYSSELEHETYPLILDRIEFADRKILLHDNILCNVTYEDGLYFISYKDLNIEVWGETRVKAEEAFKFTFYSLIINYAEEDDNRLTDDAIHLKNKLVTMIRKL